MRMERYRNIVQFATLWIWLTPTLAWSQPTQIDGSLSRELDHQQVVNDQRLPTGRMIRPVGRSIAFHGRPVDLQTGHGVLFVKDRSALRVVDIESLQEIQELSLIHI